MGNHRRLAANIGEPVAFHVGQHPVNASLQRGSAREAVARVVGEARQLGPCRAVVGESGIDDAVGGRTVLARDGAVGLGGEAGRES